MPGCRNPRTLARPARPRPRLTTAGPAFVPQVLADPEFRARGVLLGREPLRGVPLHWAVVDPARHVMTVWEKTRPSYPAAARDLGATLVTNGPFTRYGHGTLHRSAAAFGAAAARGVVAIASRAPAPDRRATDWSTLPLRHFGASAPMGHVIGTAAGIREVGVDRPRLFHFGRRGDTFDDYVIGRGDPDDLVEAVGGLFGGVSDYVPYTVDKVFRVGYWCVVPFADDVLRAHGVDAATDAYCDGTDRACPGVLMVVQGLASTRRLSRLLSRARVRDAVQIDGGDSLLLGSGTRLRQGAWMPEWKRLLQRWGLQFRPRPA